MDRILIKDLDVRCHIGVTAEERRNAQALIINIVLWVDLRPAGKSDALEDTIDYRALTYAIVSLAGASSFVLVESLAERIAERCGVDLRVRRTRVRVEKPTALSEARSVGVEITRSRQELSHES